MGAVAVEFDGEAQGRAGHGVCSFRGHDETAGPMADGGRTRAEGQTAEAVRQ
ncbi:hypothetical protein SBD_0773 [Streptomyces bottropensis ATCC 25435]|uniref:Uncharacterized protein n=1 Tax=Streptomyces bottropensis ATCC 25435 TaxID=1054862 RepID=M3DMC8_9ACTN|nr:hypothetical protein SBD_0773 [Streptomyces bottropensis ATCC 25435]